MQHPREASSEVDEACPVLVPSREIDIYAAPLFREALLAAHQRVPGLLLIDLSEVSLMDAAVLGVVVAVACTSMSTPPSRPGRVCRSNLSRSTPPASARNRQTSQGGDDTQQTRAEQSRHDATT